MQGSQRIANAHTHPHRYTAWLSREMSQATHGFSYYTKAGLVAVGATLSVAADAKHDEFRVQGQQSLRAQAPAFNGARPEVFNQHIGLGGQLADNSLSSRLFQIEDQRAFVSRLHLPPDRGTVLEQSPLPQGIARARGLDFDDISTKIRKSFTGEGAGNQLAHFQDFQALQGSTGGCKFSCGRCHGSPTEDQGQHRHIVSQIQYDVGRHPVGYSGPLLPKRRPRLWLGVHGGQRTPGVAPAGLEL